MVHPACSNPRQAHLHRLGGEPVDGQPEPEPDQCLRRDRPREVGRRQEREADQSAGDEETAHRDLDLGRVVARRRASGRAASAATGTTDTVSAAAAGERCQPSTRSRTSRNNAAVSAADSRARVRLGRSAGRCRSGVSAGTADTASAAGTASTAHGTCTTKIACHENACVSSPPATGPVAVPTTPAVTQAATPRRSPYSATRSSRQPISAARAAERLHAAGRDQHLDRRRRRAPGGRAREHRDPERRRRSAAAPA